MSEIDARLAELATGSGEWDDVVARSRGLAVARRRRQRLVIAVAIAAFVLTAGATFAIGNQFFGWFSVSTSAEEAPTLPGAAPYVAGRMLYREGKPPQRLGQPLLASLLGQDATLVVASPDQRYVAYHAWLRSTPLLYIHDTKTRTDRLLARGAQTIAWGPHGRIAYFRANHPRYDQRRGAYVGDVVVQTLDGRPVTWTKRSGGYQVLAWAGDQLLVAVRGCYFLNCRRDPAPGVYVLSSSGGLRPLQLSTLAALSPDGRYAFGRYDRVAGQDSPSSFVRVVDVRTGRAVATLDLLRPARRAGLRGLLPASLLAGSWKGDEIVGTFGGRDSALVFLRFRAGRLSVESTVRVDSKILPSQYGVSFGAPIFVGPGRAQVVVPVRATTPANRYVLAVLGCSRSKRHCVRGRVLAERTWFAVVGNPSRPLPR